MYSKSKKTMIFIMLVTLFSKVLGFIRDIILAYFFGATCVTDAYIISNSIPISIYELIGITIVTVYIPMETSILEEEGVEKADLFTSNFTNINMIFIFILYILGMIFTEQIVKIFAVGFDEVTINMTVIFTRIAFFGIIFRILTAIYSGYLQVKGNFVIPSLIGIPLNIFYILCIILASFGNHYFLAIGILLGLTSQFFLLLPFIMKHKFKYSFIFDIHDERIKKILFLSIPVIIGTAVTQVNLIIDKTIASTIVVGGITMLNYAQKLNNTVDTIFVVSILTVTYPMISTYVAQNNIESVKQVLGKTIDSIVIYILPLSIGIIIFSNSIVNILFGRGAISASEINTIASSLVFYSVGLVALGVRGTLVKVFFSFKETKIPMINTLIGVVINIILNIVLSRLLGVYGLALATSISIIVTAILLNIYLKKRIGKYKTVFSSASIIKIVFSVVLMAFTSKSIFMLTNTYIAEIFALILAVAIAIVVYFTSIYFTKVEEADYMFSVVVNKINQFRS